MAVWFTADTHLGHGNIIKFCKRPFKTTTEMDGVMIGRWNELVAPTDTIWHVGDFAFGDHLPYLRHLNGTKHLILGNHDHSNRVKPAKSAWASIGTMAHFTLEDTPIVLCHYALRVWNRSHYGALHFYGHSHGNLPGDTQSCDVGVDCWDFRPVSLEQIKQRLSMSRKRGEPDHHQSKD